jgi:membrane-bound metal-dependent hydrolase YbcI (DUF457 family)
MRRKQHMQIGAIIGAVAYGGYYFYRKSRDEYYEFNPVAFGASILAGVVGGRLPDIIEPARNPGHRKFWHSLTCAGILNAGHCFLPIPLKTVTRPFLWGYNSHLAADSKTSSLPWI